MEESLDNLDDLIRCLEEEQQRLKQSIKRASKEWEFAEAKSYAKAYVRIGARLDVLKNFRDPNLEERAYFYRRLISLEEQQKEYAKLPMLVARFQQEIDAVNLELDQLENMLRPRFETQHIDNALFDLVQGRIFGFKLHLNKNKALVLDFVSCEDSLCISFFYRKGVLWSSVKNRLRQIGFSKIKGEREFSRRFDVRQFKDAQRIKQFLAVAIYDGLGPGWIENPELEITHRPLIQE
jgi:hypothetical protein